MSTALSLAVNGINNVIVRATQATADLVNASSTGAANVDGDLIQVNQAGNDLAANALVIKTEAKMEKALIDIKV